MKDKIKLFFLFYTSKRFYANHPWKRGQTQFNYLEVEDGETLYYSIKNKHYIFYHKLIIRNSKKIEIRKNKQYIIADGNNIIIDEQFPY